jgi:hypothetical protein
LNIFWTLRWSFVSREMASCEAVRDVLRERVVARPAVEAEREAVDDLLALVVERALLEPVRALDEPDRELLPEPRPVEVRDVRVLDCFG